MRKFRPAAFVRFFTVVFTIFGLLIGLPSHACLGSRGIVCTFNPSACLKSMVLSKSVPGPILPIPATGTASLTVSNNLFIVCPGTNLCGVVCTNVGLPVSASLTITLSPPATCPGGSPSFAVTISTGAASMALPACSVYGTFNPYSVTVTIPAGTCPGIYAVTGAATVTFSDGITLTQTADTVICLVPEAPGQPGVPRLDMKLLTPAFPRLAPGDVHLASYLIKNNDPSNSVTLTAFATCKQAAVRPQGGNEAQGIFAISAPFGDDFPIAFTMVSNCIPLPSHPYTQALISNTLPVIPPLGSNIVKVAIRSYGQCASGSCCESTLRAVGFFADGSNALASASMALSVDASLPSQTCGLQVNDCNHNGIPDAADIINGTSQDQNLNGMPDECEGGANGVPSFSSVSPSSVGPGQPVFVRVAFNETFPFSSAWANGSALTVTQFFGSPLWQGTIPADTRPGPQTVYFLGRDFRGVMASYIALYTVQSPPYITAQPTNQTVAAGQTATFVVAASGAAPLSYQWYFNTNMLPVNATNSTLTLTNAQTTNAGGYSVVVTNNYGSVTSTVAVLTVNPPIPLLLGSPAYTNGKFQFSLTGLSGWTYIVQASSNLAGSNWVNLLTNPSPFTFVDTNAGLYPQRFYRARSAQ